jgi:hypothetical protein
MRRRRRGAISQGSDDVDDDLDAERADDRTLRHEHRKPDRAMYQPAPTSQPAIAATKMAR